MTKVDLGNGMSMTLRDDLSMGDVEKISRERRVWDADVNQWREDEFASLVAMIETVVEEWTIVPPVPPTGDGFRSLPLKVGSRIGPPIFEHIKALGLDDEVLTKESGS